MKPGDAGIPDHITEQEMLLAVDGELPSRDVERVEMHLKTCWTCRVHKQELESAIAGFIGSHDRQLRVPAPDGPRALLRARLNSRATAPKPPAGYWAAGIAVMLLSAALFSYYKAASRPATVIAVSVPDRQLTPGATILVDKSTLCRVPGQKNRSVPADLQRQVFQAYGIPHAEPRHYEVDYLITPALGGAEDIHNLWPQSYSGTVWNAQVKDALEDYLRELVCEGKLDLATAQQDVAENWIAAYKKYFHTDRPF